MNGVVHIELLGLRTASWDRNRIFFFAIETKMRSRLLSTFGLAAIRTYIASSLLVASIVALLACGCSAKSPSADAAKSEAVATSSGQGTVAVGLSGEPNIQLVPNVLDLGDVPWFSRIDFQVHLLNEGSESATLEAIEPSCNCTIMKDDVVGTEVRPSEALLINGVYDVGARSGASVSTILFYFREHRSVQLKVRATVLASFEIQPTMVDFGDVDCSPIEGSWLSDSSYFRTIVFRTHGADLVGHPESDVPWLQCSTAPLGNGNYEISLFLNRDLLPYGKRVARVTISTTDERQPWFTVLASANGVSKLHASPSQVVLWEYALARVRLFDENGQIVRPASAQCNNPSLSITLADDSLAIARTTSESCEQQTIVLISDDRGYWTRVVVHAVAD